MAQVKHPWPWTVVLERRNPGRGRFLAREVARAHRQGRRADAIEAARRLVAHHKVEGGDPREYLGSLNLLALMLWEQGAGDEVESLLREQLTIRSELLGDRHPDYASSLNMLALMLWEKGEVVEAEALTRRALEIQWGHRDASGQDQGRGFIDRLIGRPTRPSPSIVPGRMAPEEPFRVPGLHTSATEEGVGSSPEMVPDAPVQQDGPTSTDRPGPARGLPTPDDLLRELSSLEERHERLRDQVFQLAEAVGVPRPEAKDVAGPGDIRSFLEMVAEAEVERSRSERVFHRATAILDRISSLTHRGQPSFAPLEACQQRAREVRAAIAEGEDQRTRAWAEHLAEGQDPFAMLLRFVEDSEAMDEDRWDEAYRIVEQEFGKSMAVAAARDLLVPADPHLKTSYQADLSLGGCA